MRQGLLIGMFVILLAPTALAGRGHVDLDVDAKADLSVAARAAARGEGRFTYAWDWGDGETAVGAKARHAYREPGVYRVVVTVTDEAGRSWSRAREVEVAARHDVEAERDRALDARLDGSRARVRADVDAGARVAWDWGDGSSSSGRRAAHAYAEPGEYVVTMKVEERDGECWTRSTTVVVRGAEDEDDEGAGDGAEDEAEAEEKRERRRGVDARVRGPAVSARVSLGAHHDDAPEREPRGARAVSSVHVSSHERHEAPGAGAPLVLAGVGAMALLGRKLMKK